MFCLCLYTEKSALPDINAIQKAKIVEPATMVNAGIPSKTHGQMYCGAMIDMTV